MKVLAALSGGVDSSVAAALLVEEGHQVVGATMKLWGGPSDSGCCSVSDVDDARRVCHQLGIDHHVFNFSEDFQRHVVDPYVDAHRSGLTPNPCIECNRHIKFDRFLDRALQLGFDAVATGHHARVEPRPGGTAALVRGRDGAKDQSYVLSMLGQAQLSRLILPVGEMTKAEVRAEASRRGLRTAVKPDSQDVCFITASAGRTAFLSDRIELHPGRLVESVTGATVGTVDAIELVTVGQRRGIGAGPDGRRHYALSVDPAAGQVRVGPIEALMTDVVGVGPWTWTAGPLAPGAAVSAQLSAHGRPLPARLGADATQVHLAEPTRRVAAGQTVALYDGDEVLGSAVAR
ncbi:MAG TPA: tRNA 2-thiouridine(34) synthase MnmA [Acidimicrobiales bacterium]|nr:tRNA 2-thiouridine(34) synthase MnmA [Acidimicrobiales bacterium]